MDMQVLYLANTVDKATQALLPVSSCCVQVSIMALKQFSEKHTVEESYELPWLEEYVEVTGDLDAVAVITFAKFNAKGAMLYTNKYRAHVKAARQVYADLQEALEAYVQLATPQPLLFCGADKTKRPIVLLDDEKLCHRWNLTEGRYVQVVTEGKRVPSAEKRVNPLLAHLPQADSNAEDFSAASAGTQHTRNGAGNKKAK